MCFTIMDLIRYYFKKIFANFAIFIIIFLLGIIYILNVYEDKYVADTTFMIGACFDVCNEKSELNIELNKEVLFNYMRLIKTNKTLLEASKKEGLKYSSNDLYNMVDVSYDEDTQYIKIRVTSNNKNTSSKLSHSLFDVLRSEIIRIFDVDNIHL